MIRSQLVIFLIGLISPFVIDSEANGQNRDQPDFIMGVDSPAMIEPNPAEAPINNSGFGPEASLIKSIKADSTLDDETFYSVKTEDGNTFIGRFIAADEQHFTFYIEGIGKVSIDKNNINEKEQIDPDRIRNGSYWHENPLPSRYFFAPSAYGLRQGQGYFQNTLLLFNNVNYGITNHISAGVGIAPLSLLWFSRTPFWILPKISIPVGNDTFHLAAGAMIGGLISTGRDFMGNRANSEFLGMLYGSGTVGSKDRNLSIGIGYGYQGNNWSSRPAFNLSGMLRVKRSIYLITENYFWWHTTKDYSTPGQPETSQELTAISSVGIRWATESFSVDFYFVRPHESIGDFTTIPLAGVSFPL